MLNKSCYSNGSYINHIFITPGNNYTSHLQCVLLISTLCGGEWVNPYGQPVNCASSTRNNPLRCIKLQLTSLYTDLMERIFMKLILVVINLNVVYPVIVLVLLPTSSLFIYSVSYISLY